MLLNFGVMKSGTKPRATNLHLQGHGKPPNVRLFKTLIL